MTIFYPGHLPHSIMVFATQHSVAFGFKGLRYTLFVMGYFSGLKYIPYS